jgi:hypothetical protein
MENTITQIPDFDAARDEIIVSLYTNNSQLFDQKFSTLMAVLKSNPALSENDQKSIYQINAVTRIYNKNAYAKLNRHLQKQTRLKTKNPDLINYDTWKLNLGVDEQTLKILFATTTNLQLSTGCSNYCKRCNEWALPGVRKHFSHDAVVKIAEKLASEQNNEFALYSASDPLDWRDNEKNITHLIDNLSSKNLMPKFGLLTKIPKGKEKLFEQLMEKGTDLSASITSLNRNRIRTLETKIKKTSHKQHDTDDLLIPAGRDEDFDSIKSSITDSYGTEITPDGAFIVLPTFTSALNPTGQKRLPVNKNTKVFIKKMVGAQGLKFDYFEYLKVINLNNKTYNLDYLLEAQIENLLLDDGNYDVTQPGMMSLKEYFETFKPGAVDKRREMLSSVKKRIQLKHSGQNYTDKLEEYEILCNQTYVIEKKNKIVRNLLIAIKKYLKQNSAKRLIISHLRENEISQLDKNRFTDKRQIQEFLARANSDTFELFTQLVLMLLSNPDNNLISDFLNK